MHHTANIALAVNEFARPVPMLMNGWDLTHFMQEHSCHIVEWYFINGGHLLLLSSMFNSDSIVFCTSMAGIHTNVLDFLNLDFRKEITHA